MPSKHAVDYSGLTEKLIKKSYKLSDVESQIEKIAFDIVRFRNDDNAAHLWQVNDSPEGQYIVALYQDEDVATKIASKCPWSVIASTTGSIQISYKGDPITRLASTELGIPPGEVSEVPSYLPQKLSSNKKLVNSLLNRLPEITKAALVKKFPELGQ